jgi:hypothetical protein
MSCNTLNAFSNDHIKTVYGYTYIITIEYQTIMVILSS